MKWGIDGDNSANSSNAYNGVVIFPYVANELSSFSVVGVDGLILWRPGGVVDLVIVCGGIIGGVDAIIVCGVIIGGVDAIIVCGGIIGGVDAFIVCGVIIGVVDAIIVCGGIIGVVEAFIVCDDGLIWQRPGGVLGVSVDVTIYIYIFYILVRW